MAARMRNRMASNEYSGYADAMNKSEYYNSVAYAFPKINRNMDTFSGVITKSKGVIRFLALLGGTERRFLLYAE